MKDLALIQGNQMNLWHN